MGNGRETTAGDRPPTSYDANLVELSTTLLAMHEEAEAMCGPAGPENGSAFKHLLARRGLMLGLIRVMPASGREGLLAKARVLTIPDIGAVDPHAGWQLAESLAADVIRLEGALPHG